MQATGQKKIDSSKIAATKKKKKATAVIAASKKGVPKKKAAQPNTASTKSESKEKEAANLHVIKSSTIYGAGGDCGDGNSSSEEDYSDDEEEGEDGYKVGGYHPVCIGDKFNNRYVVIEKLGWGHFSTVWRCYDLKTSTFEKPEYIALKVQKSASHYREAAIDEIELLNCVKAATQTKASLAEYPTEFDHCIVTLVDSFDHLGRNGNHVCMAFEMLGENLLKVIKKYGYRGMPLSIVRDFAKQICIGMDFLHRHCQIIHTDLKPENILIATRIGEPDINFVKSLVGEKSSGSSVGKSGKGKKGKNSGTSASAGAAEQPRDPSNTNTDANTPGDAEKLLSPEQKKKLKKKLKKKRQLARKNEDKKKQRTSRRKGRSGTAGKRNAETSLEKANLEMMMMERASIPASMQADHMEGELSEDERRGGAFEDQFDRLNIAGPKNSSTSASARQSSSKGVSSGAKGGGPGGDNGGAYKGGYSKQDDSVDRYESKKHRDDDLLVDDLEYDADCKGGNNINNVRHSHTIATNKTQYPREAIKMTLGVEHERVYNSLPVWARQTVFSYLNFDLLDNVDPASICKDAPTKTTTKTMTMIKRKEPLLSSSIAPRRKLSELTCDEAIQILPDEYQPASKIMQAKFIMVLPVDKIVAAFGIPIALNGPAGSETTSIESNDLCYADWYLALQSAGTTLSADEKDSGVDNSMQHFAIRVQGEDVESLTSLVSFCLLNALVQQPESYVLQSLPDRMVQCEIHHHASITEHLLAYLESVLDGVRFMCHYELPFCIDDEDAELLYISRRSTRHPLCSHNLSSLLDEGKSADNSMERAATRMENKFDVVDSKGLDGGIRSGHGALIGVDLRVVTQCLACVEPEFASTELLPPDLWAATRSLEDRLRFFTGKDDDFEEAAWLFSLIHRMQYLANNSSVEGGDSELDLDPQDGDGDADQESYLGDPDTDLIDDAHPTEERGPRNTTKLDNEYRHAKLKIVDLGNACWTYKHFTDDIQTRQYRAPEVLIGASYDTSADMWSVACIIFELLTGDLMFDPQAGKNWNREEDHLALMMELLGKFPTALLPKGKFSQDYFTKKGDLRHIHNLNYWGLEGVLIEKYKFAESDAIEVADFLLGMLEMDPAKRVTAQECLQHPFITGEVREGGPRGPRYFDSKHEA